MMFLGQEMIPEALQILLFGMGGIFLVMGIITGVTTLFGRLGKGKKNK